MGVFLFVCPPSRSWKNRILTPPCAASKRQQIGWMKRPQARCRRRPRTGGKTSVGTTKTWVLSCRKSGENDGWGKVSEKFGVVVFGGVGDEGGIEMLVVVLVSLVFVGLFYVVGSSFRCCTPSPKLKFTIWLRKVPQKCEWSSNGSNHLESPSELAWALTIPEMNHMSYQNLNQDLSTQLESRFYKCMLRGFCGRITLRCWL